MLVNKVEYGHLISKYHQSENMMEKARIINVLREDHQVPFNNLADVLFEVERQLYRINGLNRLIPEFQDMATKGQLKRLHAYALSGLQEDVQRTVYQQMKDYIRKTKHEEFMKTVAIIAKEKKNTN
ncbi:hypothetical protein [Cytobacillus pseudoceanisediminis]|uniref:hypothetical protein n=1 Tax=Cytobacillus pseudoceanisediminis TaxID=3051614 RepID=UPI003C2D6233